MTWAPPRRGASPRVRRGREKAAPGLLLWVVVAFAAGCSSTAAGADASARDDSGQGTEEAATMSIPAAPASTVAELRALGRPVVLTHGGGEDAHPAETMYAYVTSTHEGVDVLDLDVWHSADDEVVVIHDHTVDRTTDGSGDVTGLTAEELGRLDAAHNFAPSCDGDDATAEEYPFRGVRSGDRPPPEGFVAEDFGVPTLRQILERFDDWVLNIEVKGDGEVGLKTAELTVDELRSAGRLDAAVVTSFDDEVVARLVELAPDLAVSPGLDASARYVLADEAPPAGQDVLQLPVAYEGIELLTDGFLSRSAEAGLAVWVWPNDADYENLAEYRRFLDRGLDGVNANCPAEAVEALEGFLEETP